MTEFRASLPEDRPGLTELWQSAFGDETGFIDAFFETGYAPERSRVAVTDGEITGMLYWFDCFLGERKLAYIYAVATQERFRGRGIASALMADVHGHLASFGYSGAVLSPGSEGLFRFYERMGYVAAGFRRELKASAGTPLPLREVGISEYARIRDRLLPAYGIRQESGNLEFLHRFARFYAGEGFAAAVSREGAYCPEFLGDLTALPGLLAALELPEAAVRTFGGEKAAAMVKWLPGAQRADSFYLGFPFD